MKDIILTGYTKKAFIKKMKNGEKGGCYLCKRSETDKSVYFLKDSLGLAPLHLRMIEVRFGDTTLNFLLCHECMSLLHGIASLSNKEDERSIFSPNMN